MYTLDANVANTSPHRQPRIYDIDVHHYVTYYLALKTGCFTDQEQAGELLR
jgi:hypothetical protein